MHTMETRNYLPPFDRQDIALSQAARTLVPRLVTAVRVRSRCLSYFRCAYPFWVLLSQKIVVIAFRFHGLQDHPMPFKS